MQPCGIASVVRKSRSSCPQHLGIDSVVMWTIITSVLSNCGDTGDRTDASVMERRLRTAQAIVSRTVRHRVRPQRNSTASIIRDRTVAKTTKKIANYLRSSFNATFECERTHDEFMEDMNHGDELMGIILECVNGVKIAQAILPVSVFSLAWILVEAHVVGTVCTTTVKSESVKCLRNRVFMCRAMEDVSVSVCRGFVRNEGFWSCRRPLQSYAQNTMSDGSFFMIGVALSCTAVVDMMMLLLRMRKPSEAMDDGSAHISEMCSTSMDVLLDRTATRADYKRRLSRMSTVVDEHTSAVSVRASTADKWFRSLKLLTASMKVLNQHNRGFTAAERSSKTMPVTAPDEDLFTMTEAILSAEKDGNDMYDRVKGTKRTETGVRGDVEVYDLPNAAMLCKFWLKVLHVVDGMVSMVRRHKIRPGEDDITYMRRMRGTFERYFIMGCFLVDCTGNITQMYEETIASLMFNILGKGNVEPGRMVLRRRNR